MGHNVHVINIIYPAVYYMWKLLREQIIRLLITRASLVAQMVKRLPVMRETWVWSLGREDLLEKEMATHSSTLAWRIPWMEEPGRLQSTGSQRVRHGWATSLVHCFSLQKEKHFFSFSCVSVWNDGWLRNLLWSSLHGVWNSNHYAVHLTYTVLYVNVSQ